VSPAARSRTSILEDALKRLVFSLLLVASSVVGAGALTVAAGSTAAHAAASVGVWVGYADGLRSGAGNFPTPWNGDPGVTFEGCNSCVQSDFDAGAIRIVNTGDETHVTIMVHIGSCTYDIWPHSVDLPVGGQLIYTQTVPGATSGCTSDGKFDTSDVPDIHCEVNDGIQPTVDVSLDGGTPTTYTDSGQVLNTGGVDGACFGNESHQWQQIGGPSCDPGATLTLAPSSQIATTGQNATVTATLTNNCTPAQPLQGATINFSVTAGPNTGVGGTGTSPTDANGQASFTYSSSVAGTDTLQASEGTGDNEIFSNPVDVTWDAGISAQPTTFAATEGQSFTGTVASFTDSDANATAGEYSATVDWGDGSPLDTTATITQNADGSFSVNGTHTYAEEGTYTVKVTITDTDNASNTATVNSTANVGDAALRATCAAAPFSPLAFSGPTANLTDANPSGSAGDFTANINWGDTFSSAGVVTGPNGGPYTVKGSHTYAASGVYTITTTVKDDGGKTATTSCSVTVFATAAPGGGSFVIGDKEAAVGTAVTFWGAQWAKINAMSGGSGPSAFKGFAESPATPACGTTWSADPGNSTPPPAGPLPAYMAVIVSSSVSKSGSSISGNTPSIVIVKTNPGYASDPGHAGTGTVVGIVC
jgi:hypothetical protein